MILVTSFCDYKYRKASKTGTFHAHATAILFAHIGQGLVHFADVVGCI